MLTKIPDEYWYFTKGTTDPDLNLVTTRNKIYSISGLKIEDVNIEIPRYWYDADRWDDQIILANGVTLRLGNVKFEMRAEVSCLTRNIVSSTIGISLFDAGHGKLTEVSRLKTYTRKHLLLSDNIVISYTPTSKIVDMRIPTIVKYLDFDIHSCCIAGSRLFISDTSYQPVQDEVEFDQVGSYIWRIKVRSDTQVDLYSWNQTVSPMIVVASAHTDIFPYLQWMTRIYLVNPRKLSSVKIAEDSHYKHNYYFTTFVTGMPVFCGIRPSGEIDVLYS
jgi:hypothetical protein